MKLRDMSWNKILRINILFAQVTLVLHRCSLVSYENVSIKSVECRIVKANEYMEIARSDIQITLVTRKSYQAILGDTQNIIVRVVTT